MAHRERYLSPRDFKKLLEKRYGVVDLLSFYRMPRWKQRRAKETVQLGYMKASNGGDGDGEGGGVGGSG